VNIWEAAEPETKFCGGEALAAFLFGVREGKKLNDGFDTGAIRLNDLTVWLHNNTKP